MKIYSMAIYKKNFASRARHMHCAGNKTEPVNAETHSYGPLLPIFEAPRRPEFLDSSTLGPSFRSFLVGYIKLSRT